MAARLLLLCVALCLMGQGTACYAESAIEIIRLETKSPTHKSNSSRAPLNQKERDAQAEKSKALNLNPGTDSDIKRTRPAGSQSVDTIVVEAEVEPEDWAPPPKTPFQKMKAVLDSAGKSEAKPECIIIRSNAGVMNNDGTLGSKSTSDARSCTPSELAADASVKFKW